MKITHVLSKSKGGIRQHVSALVDSLHSDHIDSVIVAPVGTMDILGKDQISYKPISNRNPLSAYMAYRIINRACKDADVVHAHGLTSACLVLFKIRRPKNVVVTLHNVVGDRTKIINRYIFNLIYAYIYSRAAHVVFPSPFSYEQLNGKSLRDHSIILPINKLIQQNQIDEARKHSKQTRDKYSLKQDSTLYCSVARIDKQKGLTTLIESFAKVVKAQPKSQLVIIGSGSNDVLKELVELVQSYEINDKVHFLGYIDSPYVVMCASDVVVITSPKESVSFVALEALECGLAVVMTDTGIARIALEGEIGSYVSARDDESFAKGMLFWAKQDVNDEITSRRRDVANDLLSYNNCVQPLLDIYRKIYSGD